MGRQIKGLWGWPRSLVVMAFMLVFSGAGAQQAQGGSAAPTAIESEVTDPETSGTAGENAVQPEAEATNPVSAAQTADTAAEARAQARAQAEADAQRRAGGAEAAAAAETAAQSTDRTAEARAQARAQAEADARRRAGGAEAAAAESSAQTMDAAAEADAQAEADPEQRDTGLAGQAQAPDPAQAPPPASDAAPSDVTAARRAAPATDDLAELMSMLRRQQEDIKAQQEIIAQQQSMLDSQGKTLKTLQQRVARLSSSTEEAVEKKAAAAQTQTEALQALQARVDTLSQEQQQTMTESEKAIRARLDSLEEQTKTLAEQETSTEYDISTFPRSYPIPGTAGALRVGGFVKSNAVQTFNSVGSQDRFIVGTIPTDSVEGADNEASLTADQSRISIEYRETSPIGPLRAYVEGDFAGADLGGFRLRHAFGQYGSWLIGQTWSTFMDVESSPEEIDFEGINGRINIRQPQIRFFPKFGEDYELAIAIEDPDTEITGGEGVGKWPDLTASLRSPRLKRWHVQTSFLFRSISGRWAVDPNVRESELGWAVNVSGRVDVPLWNKRDQFMFQVNYGEGLGRYVNDLDTVGGQDAVFDAETGAFEVLPVLAGYVSFQHWWAETLRSTVTLSAVNIDNPAFQAGEAYDRTLRFSGNVIWSPVGRLEVGASLLWGERVDKDGDDGSATQLQASVRYQF